ncbi:MAG: YbhB/YbcL family Raf kinase inhibitor-like protein [Vicinamibacterales bacterium]
MAFTLSSPAFANGAPVPARFTCDGDDLSPALHWAHAPGGTAAFALVMDDPDAPSGTFTHWLLCDIPATAGGLDEGFAAGGMGVSGSNDFGRLGYGGPCPPKGHGVHHYRFHLHALDRALGLKPGFSRHDIDAAIKTHVLETATLMGTYDRRRR